MVALEVSGTPSVNLVSVAAMTIMLIKVEGIFFLDMSKDACDNGDSDDYWMGNGCKESNGLSSYNGGCSDQKIGAAANNVRVWLEEHGFSKYASLFQMHEVIRKRCLCSSWKTSKRWA